LLATFFGRGGFFDRALQLESAVTGRMARTFSQAARRDYQEGELPFQRIVKD
jgi:hypothetical protein